jgi:hypothetical protein
MTRPTLIALGLLAALPACEAFVSCTEVGCSSGLFVALTHDEPLPTGTYELTVDTDADTYACTLEVVADADTCGDQPTCTTGCDELYAVSYATQDGYTTELTLFDEQPEQARLTLVDDAGDTWLDASVSPAYDTYYPNGEQCGGACTSARVDLPLDEA